MNSKPYQNLCTKNFNIHEKILHTQNWCCEFIKNLLPEKHKENMYIKQPRFESQLNNKKCQASTFFTKITEILPFFLFKLGHNELILCSASVHVSFFFFQSAHIYCFWNFLHVSFPYYWKFHFILLFFFFWYDQFYSKLLLLCF